MIPETRRGHGSPVGAPGPANGSGPVGGGGPASVVTGAAGFIGRHLVRHLGEAGHRVHAVDVRPTPADLQGLGIEWYRQDIRDRTGNLSLLDPGDTVFHLASAHLEVRADAREFEAVNVRAVETLVRSCAERGIRRLVHVSSVGIYGNVADPPANEDSPKRPATPYEITKLAGEAAALRTAAEVGLDVVVLRPTWVYGPGCARTERLLRVVQRGRFLYVGDGSNLRHPLWIGDMLEAFDLAAAAPPTAAGEAFLIGGPEVLTVRELVEICARELGVPSPRLSIPRAAGLALGWAAELAFGLIGREPPVSRRSLAFFENDNAFDTTKAARGLGFRAWTRFVEGVRLTMETTGGRLAAAVDGS